mgnify:CR=1 FL=1
MRSVIQCFFTLSCIGFAALSGNGQDNQPMARATKKDISFRRHSTVITAVAYSPDGQRIASAGRYEVKVTDLASGKVLFTVKRSKEMSFAAVAYAPDGKTLAVAEVRQKAGKTQRRGGLTITTTFIYGDVLLCDAQTGAVKAKLNDDDNPAWALAFSPDGRWLSQASGPTPDERECKGMCAAHGEVLLWDVTTGTVAQRMRGNAAAIQSVAFSPDGRWVAGGGSELQSKDSTQPDSGDPLEAFVWDAATGALAQTLKGHRTSITGLAFSPDGRWLATAARDRSLKLWNTQTWQPVKESSDYLISYDELVRASEQGKAKNPKKNLPPQSWLNAVAFTRDSRFVVGGGGDALVRLYAVETGKMLQYLKPKDWPVVSVEHYTPMLEPRISRPGMGGMPTADAAGPAMMGGGLGRFMLNFPWPYYFGGLNAMAVSPDGKMLALGLADGKVCLVALE